MGKRSKKDKIEYCIKCVTYFVDEIDDYFFDDEANKKLIKSFINSEKIVHFKVNNSAGETKTVILFNYENADRDSWIPELGKYAKSTLQENEKDVHLIGMVGSVSEKNKLSNALRLNKTMLCKTINRSASHVNTDVFFVPEVTNKPIEISVTRMNSLIFPEPNINLNVMGNKDDGKVDETCGYVFVVSLADLVNIYNQVGDELFSSNLRYGIADKMSLEVSMKKTLLEEPDMFWFYNNGITIVTEQDSIGLENAGKIILSEGWKSSNLGFSIINGAQTISTVSRIFDDESEDEGKILAAKKKAKVLLRIITAKKKATRKNITIALNRQKPVTPEDIAFQTNFVSEFNEYMDGRERDEKEYLHIIKRGESLYDDNTIELSLFARLVYACLMNPTEARNNSHADLYYKDKDCDKLNPAYFKTAFEESGDQSEKDLAFEKYYQEIIWAYRVYKAFNTELRKFDDKMTKTILANNRWSFVAYLLKSIYRFTGKELEVNYKDFTEQEEIIGKLKDYMNAFALTIDTAYKNAYTPNDSKTKEFWETLISSPQQDIFKQLGAHNPRKDEIVTKQDFIDYLTRDLGFECDDLGEEYSLDSGSPYFGEVKIVINEDTFDMSALLFDTFDDMDTDSDEDKEKYCALVDEVLDKMKGQIGSEPGIFDYFGCDDGSVDIEYCGVSFDKGLVNKFISVVQEYN